MPLPQSLDLRMLTSLGVLLETRSVSQAADRLGLSQPAASRLLARLRDQLQDPLLVRGRGGMVLTPRGESLREPLKRWLDQGETLLTPPRFEAKALKRTFRIASTDFGVASVVSAAAASIAAQAPGLSMRIERLSRSSLKALADGRLDIVIIGHAPDEPGVHAKWLFNERRTGIARRGHPADLDRMDLDTFLRWPHVTVLIDDFGDPLGPALEHLGGRQVTIAAPSFSIIPYLVAESDALAVLPSRAVARFAGVHDLQTFTPPVVTPSFDYFLAWHERSMTDTATKWLVSQLAAPFGAPTDEPDALSA